VHGGGLQRAPGTPAGRGSGAEGSARAIARACRDARAFRDARARRIDGPTPTVTRPATANRAQTVTRACAGTANRRATGQTRASARRSTKTRVQVPHTDHVYAKLPSKLQALLDDDPRMQPWLDKVIAVADRCYGRARGDSNAGGTIVLQLTMHENARPDVDIESLPAQLSSVVACATSDLMRSRSPLFTSGEGERYTVELHFEP
jgi:hypothetical protein